MKIITTTLPDLLLIEPTVHGDDRGFFMESYNAEKFNELVGRDISFVQDNHSRSVKNVLRGLHFQKHPAAQGKLVRCTYGEVYDVVVDLRISSPGFKKWFGVNLSSSNKKQLWIPEGFAHGFLVLSDEAEFMYKTTAFYSPENDRCLKWDDTTIGVKWPIGNELHLSDKDANGDSLAQLRCDLFA